MDELAERDDDGGLEDDEEQRVQRHVLDGAVAPDGLHVAGRSEARRRIIPTPASCERGGGLGGRAPAGECAEGTAGRSHGMRQVCWSFLGGAALGE